MTRKIIESLQAIRQNGRMYREELVKMAKEESERYSREVDDMLSNSKKEEQEAIRMVKSVSERDRAFLKAKQEERNRVAMEAEEKARKKQEEEKRIKEEQDKRIKEEQEAQRQREEREREMAKARLELQEKQKVQQGDLGLFHEKCRQWEEIYLNNRKEAERTSSSISTQERLQWKIKINKRIGQISKSTGQIEAVAKDLLDFIRASENERVLPMVMDMMSEKWTEQAETQVSSMTPSAFFIASCMVRVASTVPQMLTVWLGRIVHVCPMVTIQIDSDKDRNSWTPLQMERMAGILSLFGAVLQTNVSAHGQEMYDLPMAWAWIVGILNAKQAIKDPCIPYMLITFLQVSGFALEKKYGIHFIKLLHCVQADFLSLFKQNVVPSRLVGSNKQGLVRLELYLDQIMSKYNQGHGYTNLLIEEPEGRRID
jgi:nucleoporin GLE1